MQAMYLPTLDCSNEHGSFKVNQQEHADQLARSPSSSHHGNARPTRATAVCQKRAAICDTGGRRIGLRQEVNARLQDGPAVAACIAMQLPTSSTEASVMCYMECSTVGQAVARRLACPLFDGDDFHPPDNIGTGLLAALQASLVLFYLMDKAFGAFVMQPR